MSVLLVSDLFDLARPSRLLDILSPAAILPRGVRCPYSGLRRPRAPADRFEAHLDVQHFRPEEISVKVCDGAVVVEGSHEEKEDEHGFVSRRFIRRYLLPQGHDLGKVESRLSSDGVLTITAPKIDAEERSVPVVQTGQPSKVVEQKKQEEKELKNDEKK